MADTIYKSVYSNVPVLEIVIRSIPVMRRRKDDWLNATQILKIAGFDKPQRTRILEREVQKGTHEKVQGGYGKYQGTWIPFERGVELATQYEVSDVMAPIINYIPGSTTPPTAPKHATAAGRVPRNVQPRIPRKPKPSPRKMTLPTARPPAPIRIQSSEISDASIEDVKSERSISPARSNRSSGADTEVGLGLFSDQYGPGQLQISGHSEKLLEFFTDPRSFPMPDFLREPPPDFDANATIDDEGHSALHWASAMGLLEVVGYLKHAGADISCGNGDGQTPLMRTVAFCNNYDLKTFPEIVLQLKDSAHMTDNANRTIFHHIALSTNQPSKTKIVAARYYAEQLCNILTRAMKAPEFNLLINHQDRNGETALVLAARNGAKKVWRILLEYNANPHISNHEGHTAQEFIDIYDAGRNPLIPSSSPAGTALEHASTLSAHLIQQHKSEVAIRTTHKVVPQMQEALIQLANAFDNDFAERDEDIRQAQRSLAEMHREIQVHREWLKENDSTILQQKISDAESHEEECRQELHRLIDLTHSATLKSLIDTEDASATNSQSDNLPDRESLAKRLEELQDVQQIRVVEIVEIMRMSNLGPQMKDYRKLISLACSVPIDQIDGKLPGIEEVLRSSDEKDDSIMHDIEPFTKL